MKIIYTILFLSFFSIKSIAQGGYLLQSREYSTFDSQGTLLGENFELFTYDEVERLIKKEGSTNLVNYAYEDNIVRSTSYFKPELELYLTTREDLNDEGFRVRREQRYESNPPIIYIDSFIRNNNNFLIRDVSYFERLGEINYKSGETFYSYNPEGQIILIEIMDFSSETNEVVSIEKISSEYNSDGLLERQIFNIQEFELNENYSDTLSFVYMDGELIRNELRKYSALGFEYCQQQRYFSDGEAEYRYTDRTNNFDCTEYLLTGLREDYLNKNNIRNRDSLHFYSYDSQGEVTSRTFISNVQDGDLGDEDIYIDYEALSFQNENLSFRDIDYQYYTKSTLTSVEEAVGYDELKLLPNLAESDQIIRFESASSDYNNYKIVNVAGQVIKHVAVHDKKNTLFKAPKDSGVYFVQLLQDRLPVSKTVKLVVR